MITFFKKIWNVLLDLLFPKACFGCGIEGTICCDTCLRKIVREPYQRCPACHTKSENGRTHSKCHEISYLDFLLISCYYSKNPVLKKLISLLKYRGDLHDSPMILGLLMKTTLEDRMRYVRNFTIIPVPLHWRRRAFRGFNQSELLSRTVAKHIPSLIIDTEVLKRERYTTPQVAVKSREHRMKNLSGCFEVTKNIAGKNFLLVDDVCTTGTTLEECAKALKSHGARNVGAIVVASNR